MEVELFTEGTSEDENYILDDQIEDYLDIEGERCGICMEIVIDRGVLDCCQHWFCFACIDNWASITSLCPLCQNEFQLITCVRVYDTVGGSKTDEDTNSREDDDWFVEGESNSLSFHSYYIDENAVVCLDGDGCKIRSGSVAVEEDSDVDTSIACDSCDRWYHAFCVAFDPDGTCDSSWLCPRCLVDKVPNNLELGSVARQSYQHGLEVASTSGSRMEDSFSGKVSVSLADDGETAVVVSLIEGHQKNRESSESILDFRNDMNSTFWSSSTSYMPEPKASLNTMISVDVKDNDTAKDHESEFVEPNISSIECTTTADKILSDNMEVIASPPDDKEPATMRIKSSKRKQGESRNTDGGELQADNEAIPSQKKIKAGKNTNLNSLKEQTLESISEDSRTVSSRIISKDNKSKRLPEKKNATVDIMAIVKGTDHRSLKQLPSKTSSGATLKEKESAGLRLKKIMRRADDNKDSSMQVQELREKIREAVRNKSSKEIRENHFDTKLLDAFRAALAGSGTENRKPALDLKAKRSMLQKGKIRESLTKKIYGAGGKRKRAWSRECEVEFWKHRCQKVSRPEKVETLKSVLDLLRDDSADNIEKMPGDGEQRGSVLSRLYLADNSVFPRKNDIGPISSTTNATTTPELKRGSASIGNSSLPLLGFSDVIQLNKNIPNKVVVPPIDSKGINKSINGKKLASEKEVVNKLDTSKGDKRKWALELLARKTASPGKKGQEDEKDNGVLKGSYPLLAQLQKDMRPVLAPSCHNKISVPVRQAQLNRLTEHFLKKANLSIVNRTAEIELAVADAVNIEKEIADKSKSKLVYVNLCSQELSRRSDNTNSVRSRESNTSKNLGDEISEEENNTSDSAVDEALRNAGLLSDSPPDSPNHEIDSLDTEVGSAEPDNVLEADTLAELDIYGDFEYNLEDDDFLGVGNLEISKPQPEEPKIKMVFSSFVPEKLTECSTEESKPSHKCVVQIPMVDGDEEPSIAECEELYGPEKEPLILKYPEIASITREETLSKESPHNTLGIENVKEKISKSDAKHLENKDTVMKKVEAFIKEHLRPLCKSGVITVDQYQWAVGKTTEKVMKYHSKEKNASFLIKEGEKVKKLAQQYVEAAPNKAKK